MTQRSLQWLTVGMFAVAPLAVAPLAVAPLAVGTLAVGTLAVGTLAGTLGGCATRPAATPPGGDSSETTDEPADPERGETPGRGSAEGRRPRAPADRDASSDRGARGAPTGNAARAPSSSAAPPSDAALRKQFAGRKPLRTLHGRAAYYHDSLAGNRTASGERYDPAGFTAAHRTLPFGTVLRVRRVKGSTDVYVRVTDRGPFGSRRLVLDLSRAAAEQIGLIRPGVADVVIEVLRMGPGRAGSAR